MSDLTCRELIDFLDDFVENELPADRRAVFEAHLAICPDCRAYLDSYRASIGLVGELRQRSPESRPPADVPQSLLHAAKQAMRKQGN